MVAEAEQRVPPVAPCLALGFGTSTRSRHVGLFSRAEPGARPWMEFTGPLYSSEMDNSGNDQRTSPALTDTAVGVTAAVVAASVAAAPVALAAVGGGLIGVGAVSVARRLGLPVDRAAAAAARGSGRAVRFATSTSRRVASQAADTSREVASKAADTVRRVAHDPVPADVETVDTEGTETDEATDEATPA